MLTPTRLLHSFQSPTPQDLRFHEGTTADYERFKRFHYRADAPATRSKILIASIDTEPAGILIVSRPVLNAPWRKTAWPGDYDSPDLAHNARRINAELRTISRVVVDPRFRACGVAVGLVREYLANPLTERTEAIAAIGFVCPFFERAGMRRLPHTPSTRDTRLAKVLTRLDRTPASLLSDREIEEPALAAAVRAWARASKATRAIADGPIRPLAARAACGLLVPPVAYAHDRSDA